MSDCVFCKIVDGSSPSTKVYEDERIMAVLDLNPQAPVHVLVVPKEHIDSANAVTAENADCVAACFRAIPAIAAAEGLTEGYRVINNCGKAAGQTVMHLHFHLIGGCELGEKIV